jgi:hypothetical protein
LAGGDNMPCAFEKIICELKEVEPISNMISSNQKEKVRARIDRTRKVFGI